MKWRTADVDAVVAVEFLVGGEYVIPDAGTLSATVRGNSGDFLPGFNPLSLQNVSGTMTTFVIPASNNSIMGPLETRWVSVSFKVKGFPQVIDQSYRLTPFLPIQKTFDDVRNLVGATYTELPDNSIDLIEAYFKLSFDIGSAFAPALLMANRASICANNLIALQAAITALPSLQTRMLKGEISHGEEWQRSKVDFVQLLADLRNAFNMELSALNNVLSGVTASTSISPIFIVTSPVDPITGV